MSSNKQSTFHHFDTDAVPESDRTITVAHIDDPYDVYGGRGPHGRCLGATNPGKRGWLGNPHRLAYHSRQEAIEKFETAFLAELRENWHFCNAVIGPPGQVVACHCRHIDDDEPACHLDVIREALLDGTVFSIALDHDIAIPEWQQDVAEGADGQ